MILKTVGNRTGVSPGIDFKTIRDTVKIQGIVQFAAIRPQPILITHVYRNAPVPA